MILIAIVVLLFLFFCVLTYFFTKTWRATHIVFAFLVFVMSVVMMALISLNAKTRIAWMEKKQQLEERLKEEQLHGWKLAYGDPEDPVPSDTVITLQERLMRLTFDRGRVWRLCQPGPYGNGQVVVNTVPPEVLPEKVVPPGVDMIVYAFRDLLVNMPGGSQERVPGVYLGEFRVTAEQNKAITMAMTLPNVDQIPNAELHLGDANATWTLYEIMPVDLHEAFVVEDSVGMTLDDTQEQSVFGSIDDTRLRDVMKLVFGSWLPAPQRAQLAQQAEWPRGTDWEPVFRRYERDGRAIVQGDQMVPDRERWIKVKFLQPYPAGRDGISVDSDSAGEVLEGGFFDVSGKAVVTRLQAGEQLRFKENEIAMFDAATAEDLIGRGTCEKIADIYVRPLNDYDTAFHEISAQIFDRDENIRMATRDIAALDEAMRRTQDQTDYRTSEKDRLVADREKHRLEQQRMTALVAVLQQQKADLTQQLSNLYQTNLVLAERLTHLNRQLTDEINRRTAEATAQVGQ